MTAREDIASAAFERVTVFLTPASSAALVRAVEAVGDNRTDTINRAIQTYALMVGEVADGGRVLVQQTGESTQPAPFVPRTERSYWVAIADALNAANAAGMPIGIDLDGTLTDHNAWAVIWNRETERWEVGGYDIDTDGAGEQS